jgi:peptide deformylase
MKILDYEEMKKIESSDVTEKELEEMYNIAQDMIPICKEAKGIGLAAPQVGVYKNFFVWTRDSGLSYETAFNPKVYRDKSSGFTNTIEGCLSTKGNSYYLKRAKKVNVIYYIYANGKFAKKIENFKKPFSFVWQHEIEHLKGNFISDNGILLEKGNNE